MGPRAPLMLQRWLSHAQHNTTVVYADTVGRETHEVSLPGCDVGCEPRTLWGAGQSQFRQDVPAALQGVTRASTSALPRLGWLLAAVCLASLGLICQSCDEGAAQHLFEPRAIPQRRELWHGWRLVRANEAGLFSEEVVQGRTPRHRSPDCTVAVYANLLIEGPPRNSENFTDHSLDSTSGRRAINTLSHRVSGCRSGPWLYEARDSHAAAQPR